MNFTRLALLVWAVFFGFVATAWIGSTHLLSSTFHIERIDIAANVIFITATILSALVLNLIIPKSMSKKIAVVTFLLPLLFLFFLIV